MEDTRKKSKGPVWKFEPMWDKPHYNEGTEISNAPGVGDAPGIDASKRKSNGPVWAFEKMWNKPHYNEGDEISNAPGYSDAPGDYTVGPDGQITPIHYPWCGYWPYKYDADE